MSPIIMIYLRLIISKKGSLYKVTEVFDSDIAFDIEAFGVFLIDKSAQILSAVGDAITEVLAVDKSLWFLGILIQELRTISEDSL